METNYIKTKKVDIALETSLNGVSVAVFDNNKLIDFLRESESATSSEDVLTMIEMLFKKNGISIQQVERVMVSNGPGSLTGLRIGLATAKGLANSASAEIVIISLFERLASNFEHENKILVAVYNVKRNAFFYQRFESIGDDKKVPVEDVRSLGAEEFYKEMSRLDCQKIAILSDEKKSIDSIDLGRKSLGAKTIVISRPLAVMLGDGYESYFK